MTLIDIAKQVERYAINNSPTILAGVGAAGTVMTAVLTGRAFFRVGQDVNARHYEPLLEGNEPEYLTPTDIAKEYWTEFVPPAVMGLISVTAIISANRIGTRRAAAVAAAYTLSEKAFEEYRDKVVQKIGEKKAKVVRDEIAQDRVTNDPPSSKEVVITGNGEVMCYDTLTGRYFKSSMESVRKAMNDVNKQVLDSGYASLTEFYDRIGLSGTQYSEEVGWTYDNMVDVCFSTVISEDGQPCLAIQYNTAPVRNYYKLQ